MADLIQHDGRQINPARVYLATLQPGGRTGVYYQLRAVAKILTGQADIDQVPWHRVDRQTVIAIVEKLRSDGKAPATVNHTLSILKRVSEEAMGLGMMDLETYTRVSQVRRPKGSRLPAGKALARQVVRAAIDRCLQEDTGKGLRDATLLAVGTGCGLRCDELTNLRVTDVSADLRSLRFIGKGNKEAVQPVPPATAELLEEHLDQVRSEGPLFPRWRRHDCAAATALTEAGVYFIVRHRLGGGTTPHDLRRSFATWLDEDGQPLSVIQRLMRHSNPETTMRYIRNNAKIEEAGAALSF